MTKSWVNGRASEDRDEWTEEVKEHCEKCYDDIIETREVQAERVCHQRSQGVWSLFMVGENRSQSTRSCACGEK